MRVALLGYCACGGAKLNLFPEWIEARIFIPKEFLWKNEQIMRISRCV